MRLIGKCGKKKMVCGMWRNGRSLLLSARVCGEISGWVVDFVVYALISGASQGSSQGCQSQNGQNESEEAGPSSSSHLLEEYEQNDDWINTGRRTFRYN